jgi:hypothetical protein
MQRLSTWPALATLLLALAPLTLPSTATAQPLEDDAGEGLGRILQGLSWGDSHETVLEYYRQRYLDDYRTEIAGLRDTLEINEIRRYHEQRFDRVESSLETFDGTRTGYEVSVIGDEVAAGNEESMLTVRTDNALLYYIFASDHLYKIVVAYNSSYLGVLEFEAFIEQLEARYGPPLSTEFDETATGIRYLARATWEEDDTRLRVENQSNLFGTFIMVFTSPQLEDRVVRLRGAGDERSSTAVSDAVRRLGQTPTAPSNRNIADQIIGAPTTVELVVPEAPEPNLEPPPPDAAVSAEQEAAEREDEEADEREEHRHHRRDDDEDEDEEPLIIE